MIAARFSGASILKRTGLAFPMNLPSHLIAAAVTVLCLSTHSVADEIRTLVWSDEFETSGLPDSNKWTYDEGGSGWGNNELQYYTRARSENARVENGVLVIEARKESFGGRNYTSARLRSKGSGDWTYGRFEIRAKLPRGRGTWPAIWMLPTDRVYGSWPASGEIDIMEHVGYDMNRIHATIHTQAFNHMIGTQIGTNTVATNVDTQFHVYTLEWRPGRVDVYVDDTRYFTATDNGSGSAAWPFDQRFHLLLNVAVGGNWGAVQGVDDSIFPQRMEVDYVRVYAFEDSNSVQAVPGRVEAEDFSSQSGTQLEVTSDTGGGNNVGYLTHGDWLEYRLNVPIAGRYGLDLRYASPNGNAALSISTNGGPTTSTGLLPKTNGWQTWATTAGPELELPAGPVTVRMTVDSPIAEDLNLNWINIALREAHPLVDPTSDPDHDGLVNLLEHALALDPLEPNSAASQPGVTTTSDSIDEFLQLTYRRRTGGSGTTGVDYTADGVAYRVEVSPNLAPGTWTSGSTVVEAVGSPSNNGDGSETVTVRSRDPISDQKHFIRLRVTTVP